MDLEATMRSLEERRRMLQSEIDHLKKERGQLPDRTALDTTAFSSASRAWPSVSSELSLFSGTPERSKRPASVGSVGIRNHTLSRCESASTRREARLDLSFASCAFERPPRPGAELPDRRHRQSCSVPVQSGLAHEQLVARARLVQRETMDAIERSKLSRSQSTMLRAAKADATSPSTASTAATSFSRPDLQWGASSRWSTGAQGSLGSNAGSLSSTLGLALGSTLNSTLGSPYDSRWSEASATGVSATTPQPLCHYPPSPEDWPAQAPSSSSARKSPGSSAQRRGRGSPASQLGTSPLRRGRQAWEALEAVAPQAWQDASGCLDRSARPHKVAHFEAGTQGALPAMPREELWARVRLAARGASPRPQLMAEPSNAGWSSWARSHGIRPD